MAEAWRVKRPQKIQLVFYIMKTRAKLSLNDRAQEQGYLFFSYAAKDQVI